MTGLEVTPLGRLSGEVAVPGDKSVSHRALLLNALAKGSARIRGIMRAGDVDATARALRQMGVQIEEGDEWVVRSAPKLSEPDSPIDCGNSGTSMRLLTGVVASRPLFAVLTGDASLRRRPMRRIIDPLTEMGARIDGREGGRYAPLAIRGQLLHHRSHDLPISSAQVKSALLIAGLENGVVVREPRPSRDHTERMLHAMGAGLRRQKDGWLMLVPSLETLRAVDVDVPRDVSQAAFFLVAATLLPGSDLVLPRVGTNPTRSGVLDALRAMGAQIEAVPCAQAGVEPIADLHVTAAPLRGTEIRGDLALRCIDEIPVLAVAAAFAEGETVIADAAELRVKESDRIAKVAAGLKTLGIEVEERPDGMVISGGRPRGPAQVDATGDHRIAMAFAVAGLCCDGGVRIEGADSVESSYPAFFQDLRRCCGGE